jgi:predicted enzyme related to lactoylglutathione lyase
MGAPFVWFDLTVDADDASKTTAFYSDLFGWPTGPGLGDYQSWVTDGTQPWAGVLPTDADRAGRWIPFVAVDDLDSAAEKARALGGSVVGEKKAGPAGTSILVSDPGGATIALFTPQS